MTNISQARAQGFTHLRVECRAPLAGGGYCQHLAHVPWDRLPAGLLRLNPAVDALRTRFRCQGCGIKGWTGVSAWKDH